MRRILNSYIFWTYERGSFHYDIMVTLILIFIFFTPHVWNYRDHPTQPGASAGRIQAQVDGNGELVYEIPAHEPDLTAGELEAAIQPLAGRIAIDRFQPIKDANGHVTAYRMWAHR